MLAKRCESTGAGGAIAGGNTTAASVAGCAAAGAECAGEAADVDPGSVEAESR